VSAANVNDNKLTSSCADDVTGRQTLITLDSGTVTFSYFYLTISTPCPKKTAYTAVFTK